MAWRSPVRAIRSLEDLTATAAAARGRACAFGVDPKASDVEECVQALRAVTKATFDDYIGEICTDSQDAPRELEGEWGENQEFVAWLGKGWSALITNCSSETIREAFRSKQELQAAAKALAGWSRRCGDYGMDSSFDGVDHFRSACDKAKEIAASWPQDEPDDQQSEQGAAKRQKGA